MILQVLFLILLLVPSGLVAAYYLVWAVARVAGLQDTKRPAPPARHRIRIVIPAHDEQDTLPATLDSCARLDYPRDLYAVTVVADNCHDATAHVARQRGVDCIERSDPARPGKGFALGWALDQLRAAPHDALLVLDADCTLDSQALQVLDAFLQDGARVLQANHRVVNADASPISYAGSGGAPTGIRSVFLAQVTLRSGRAAGRHGDAVAPFRAGTVSLVVAFLHGRHGIHAATGAPGTAGAFRGERVGRMSWRRNGRSVAHPAQPLGSRQSGTQQVSGGAVWSARDGGNAAC